MENNTSNVKTTEKPEETVVKTNEDKKDGQNKCPKCGATDISLNVKNGMLRCNYCRHEFETEKGLTQNDISSLEGDIFSTGTKDIEENAENMITLKCSSCGAEVVIDTSETMQARCHWCRNTLSINNQVPNGSVPDVVLPFNMTKQEASELIKKFVGKRKFFAHPKFRHEFTTNNIMGVYFPYMIVDMNAHANFVGEGEHEVRSYTVGSDDNEETYYDADVYEVEREFDIEIDDLTVESSIDKLDTTNKENTNNIINSILPFDTENCVKWEPNYLKGYSSEKRDINVEELRPVIEEQGKDVARFAANESLRYYDRGVHWEREDFDIKGQKWLSAYLPVWLYSYQQEKNNKKKLHYVAVNSRTKETMGSVPIHIPKLIFVSLIVEAIGGYLTYIAEDFENARWLFLLSGIIYYIVIYNRYRNSGARHGHEDETKRKLTNMRKVDKKTGRRKRLSSSTIAGQNNTAIRGNSVAQDLADSKNQKDTQKDK